MSHDQSCEGFESAGCSNRLGDFRLGSAACHSMPARRLRLRVASLLAGHEHPIATPPENALSYKHARAVASELRGARNYPLYEMHALCTCGNSRYRTRTLRTRRRTFWRVTAPARPMRIWKEDGDTDVAPLRRQKQTPRMRPQRRPQPQSGTRHLLRVRQQARAAYMPCWVRRGAVYVRPAPQCTCGSCRACAFAGPAVPERLRAANAHFDAHRRQFYRSARPACAPGVLRGRCPTVGDAVVRVAAGRPHTRPLRYGRWYCRGSPFGPGGDRVGGCEARRIAGR